MNTYLVCRSIKFANIQVNLYIFSVVTLNANAFARPAHLRGMDVIFEARRGVVLTKILAKNYTTNNSLKKCYEKMF